MIFFLTLTLLSELIIAEQPTKTLKVGIFQNKPIVFKNHDGKPEGLYVDLLNEVAQLENWKIEYVFDSFSGIVQKLKNKEIHLISSIAYNASRKQVFDFSKIPVWTLWGTVYARPEADIKSILDLDGKKISVMEKGILGIEIRKLCDSFSINCAFQSTVSQSESIQLLSTGKVDAAVFNNIFAISQSQLLNEVRKSSIIFSPLKASFASLKGENHEILDTIDLHLKTWKQNQDSIYYRSLKRWMEQIEVEKKVIPDWLYWLIGFSIFILCLLFLWTRLLRRQVLNRTKALNASNLALLHESEEKKLAQKTLQIAHDELEQKVQTRTKELNKINQQLNLEIADRKKAEEQIKTALKEKEILLNEIHHRVKNSLSVASGLLMLQSLKFDDDKLKAALMDSQNRIRSISYIHETLYQSEDFTSIDLKKYLSKLSMAVAENYSGEGKIELKFELNDIVMGAKEASTLGLIVNELITNSFKYAFPNNREGEIKIALRQIEDQIELVYADNGIGIPEDFDWENTKSMGLNLLKMLTKNQLKGSIDMESKKGTKFTIKFNLEDTI